MNWTTRERTDTPPGGGRALGAWEEGTLARADELDALCAWNARNHGGRALDDAALVDAVRAHLDAARAATHRPPWPRPRRTGARLERAISNLDAADAHILQMAPAPYLLGQVPSLLHHVRRHLQPGDPRRQEMERIAKWLGVAEPGQPPGTAVGDGPDPRLQQVEEVRGRIVSAVRGASSVALREQNRVRSFRNVVVVATVATSILAASLAVIGWLYTTALPLCFAPEEAGLTTVVCPSEHSGPVPTPGAATRNGSTTVDGDGGGPTSDEDIDNLVGRTAEASDIALVELVGLTAAGIAAAGAIRGIRGSSEPYGVPIALALLKLPTGAVTAVLGLLLMRGGFIPGLSALDTSAQILAWAIVFGYAQQVFTRLVDQQAHLVLDGVRGGDQVKSPDRTT